MNTENNYSVFIAIVFAGHIICYFIDKFVVNINPNVFHKPANRNNFVVYNIKLLNLLTYLSPKIMSC